MSREFNSAVKAIVAEYRKAVTENEELKSLLMGALKIMNHDVIEVNYRTKENIKMITEKAERILK